MEITLNLNIVVVGLFYKFFGLKFIKMKSISIIGSKIFPLHWLKYNLTLITPYILFGYNIFPNKWITTKVATNMF